MKLLNELLTLNQDRLTENVNNAIDRVNYHFDRPGNPLDKMSPPDILNLAYELGALEYLAIHQDKISSIDDFSRTDDKGFSLKFYRFLSDIDEASQAKLFDKNSKGADDFLIYLGSTLAKKESAFYLKAFESIKKGKNVEMGKRELLRKIEPIKADFQKIFRELKAHFSKVSQLSHQEN